MASPKTFDSYVKFERGSTTHKCKLYVIPESYTTSNSAEIGSQSVIGRGAPYMVYNGGSQRSSSLKLTLRLDHEMYITGETDLTKTDTYKAIKGFEASVYPAESTVHDRSGVAAPRVTIVLGRSLCVYRGIVTSCNITGQLPVITINNKDYYSTIDIDISINHAPDPAYTAKSVYSNSSVLLGDVYPDN